MAHSPRGWTGARTPSAIKRVRQTARRRLVNQPRRSAAKTLVSKAVLVAGDGDAQQAREALVAAISALDRAAKSGAIHPNAAARRESRLTLKVAAALGGEEVSGVARAARTTGKAAAAKQAKARIAASRATKAKGAQTAAGKARVAIARSTREQGPSDSAAPAGEPESTTTSTTGRTTKATTARTTKATTARTTKATAKPAAAGSTRVKAQKSGDEKAAAKPRTTRSTKKD